MNTDHWPAVEQYVGVTSVTDQQYAGGPASLVSRQYYIFDLLIGAIN